jgi:ubiquinone/menaquinone biosynthesis C-methylase UbiE
MTPAETDSAKSYYEFLARDYSKRANVHANERYWLECLKALQGCRSVLDVGCGTADLLFELRRHLMVLGIDITQDMLESGPGRGYVAAAAAGQLPFEDNVFDGAYSINLLEHVPEPGRVLEEIARVVRVGGRVALATPAAEWTNLLDWAERFKLKIPEGPHRFLTREELLGCATDAALQTVVYRRILVFPAGGKKWAHAAQSLERWTPGLGSLHWLVTERRAR